MRSLLAALTASAMLAVAAPSYADTFTYDFSDTDGTRFLLTTPELITSYTQFYPSANCFYLGGYPCTDVEIVPEGHSISVNDVSIGDEFLFSDDFFTVGFHQEGSSTITISDDSVAPVATPEPSTLGLVATGVVGLLGAGRRRMLRRSSLDR